MSPWVISSTPYAYIIILPYLEVISHMALAGSSWCQSMLLQCCSKFQILMLKDPALDDLLSLYLNSVTPPPPTKSAPSWIGIMKSFSNKDEWGESHIKGNLVRRNIGERNGSRTPIIRRYRPALPLLVFQERTRQKNLQRNFLSENHIQ